MANSPVVGTGPIQFTDNGQQLSIPLTDLAFDSGGNIVNNWPLYSQHTKAADAWLHYLNTSGAIYPGPTPAPSAAMVITAHNPGSSGNNIAITFSNVGTTDPTNPNKFDASVNETDTYKGLTKDTLADALTKRPGLVTLGAGAPATPGNGTYPMPNAAPFKVSVLQSDNATQAFELDARGNDPESQHTTVTISNASANSPLFDMTVTWQKSASKILVAGLGAAFAYEIDVAAPDGGSLSMPSAGIFNLRGGAEAAPATSAKAIVVGG